MALDSKHVPLQTHAYRQPDPPPPVLSQKLLQGLKGERSPGQVCDGLESNSWYQVSAVAERAEDVFSEPIYAVVKTHREPARVMEIAAHPVPGSTDSLALLFRLDCSSASIISEACGLLRWGSRR